MADNKTSLNIQKIYLKDISFESPNSPAIFAQEWQPKADLNINTQPNKISDKQIEVVLTATLTVKQGDQVAYLVEAQQAGLFEIEAPEEQMEALLLSYCPNLLFPYLREEVSNIVMKGGFPQFVMQPVNFDLLLAEAKKRRESVAVESDEAVTKH